MRNTPFIGRETEMERLKGLLNKKSASLIVARGRRRIGKSRLLAEFGKGLAMDWKRGTGPKSLGRGGGLQRGDPSSRV